VRAKISKAVCHHICLSTNPTKAARIKIKNKARNISYKSVDFPRGLNREKPKMASMQTFASPSTIMFKKCSGNSSSFSNARLHKWNIFRPTFKDETLGISSHNCNRGRGTINSCIHIELDRKGEWGFHK
jgi:hypothetical protein